jgi:hypothetical protein
MTDTTAATAGSASATAPASDTPGEASPAAPASPALVPGNLISYTWEDTYAEGAERTRYGIVVAKTEPDPANPDAPPTVTVAWLEGAATMVAADLSPVAGA